MKTSKRKDRWMYGGATTLVMIIIIFSLSSILSYFKSGAEKTIIYDQGHKILREHNPQITWLADDNKIGGEMNNYLRTNITQGYSDAWGILNLSMAKGSNLGLSENFTEQQVEQLINVIHPHNKVIKKDLSHLLKLHFVSLDKQVVSFSDKKMVTQVLLPESANLTLLDSSEYKVLMLLDDGKWRVDKLIRVAYN